jgi:hypothetical protein
MPIRNAFAEFVAGLALHPAPARIVQNEDVCP